MAKMLAAKLFGPRDTRVVEVDRPEPGEGEILVRVKAVAICPSDLRLWEDGHAGGTYPDHPFTQGHEFSGVVEQLGPGVDGPEPGTPVAVTPLWPCFSCDMCRLGYTNICRNITFPSFPQTDGAMAEFIAVPAWAVEPIPEGLDFVHAALLEPLQASLHGFEVAADLQPDAPIAVVGAGMIGLGVIQIARARGFSKIMAAEPIESHRRLAQEWGASVVAPFATDLLDELASVEEQPAVVFECSGHYQALADSMALCRPRGQVVIIGVPHPDEIPFDTRHPRRKELSFVFSRRYLHTDLKRAVELVASGAVDLSIIPVRTYPLQRAPEAMAEAASKPRDVLRIVVVMD